MTTPQNEAPSEPEYVDATLRYLLRRRRLLQAALRKTDAAIEAYRQSARYQSNKDMAEARRNFNDEIDLYYGPDPNAPQLSHKHLTGSEPMLGSQPDD